MYKIGVNAAYMNQCHLFKANDNRDGRYKDKNTFTKQMLKFLNIL